jgi:hypothetical protein
MNTYPNSTIESFTFTSDNLDEVLSRIFPNIELPICSQCGAMKEDDGTHSYCWCPESDDDYDNGKYDLSESYGNMNSDSHIKCSSASIDTNIDHNPDIKNEEKNLE